MFHVICYDISADASRNRMAETLLDFGVRIQESVFECVLAEGEMDKLMSRVKKIELEDTDKVRVYRVCQRCLESVVVFGPASDPRLPDFFVL